VQRILFAQAQEAVRPTSAYLCVVWIFEIDRCRNSVTHRHSYQIAFCSSVDDWKRETWHREAGQRKTI